MMESERAKRREPGGAERGSWGPASDAVGGAAGAKPPGLMLDRAGQRRRRHYRILPKGRQVLANERSVWHNFFAMLDRVAKIVPAR